MSRLFALVATFFLVLAPSLAQSNEQTPMSRARAVLSQGASEKDPETRRELAIVLSLSSSKDPSMSLLESLARDKDHLCREAAIVSIGELGDRKLAKLVRPALEDNVPEVVFAAAKTLFRLGQPEGKQMLISILEKEEKADSGFIREKLRDIARRMKTPKSALLFTVQRGVGFLPVPGLGQGFSAMNSMVGDADFSPRATALLMLASDHSPQVRTIVEQSLSDEDWSVRAAAIQVTALWNERFWRTRLIPLFEDSNRKVRFRAATVFLRLNHPSGQVPVQGKP